ncbi:MULTISPECIES: octopine ABC transporter permease OccQ [Rhizobium/Agrobacterium group]|uniref:Octopine transport system permease protein OccQ n=6 Tax=Agrobacterium tumefaciens TaxID=358 RepID=OCCQ_AGRTU|nr:MULTISPECIES: octopine ABC transporter permease OccQ [Rhizobium/Agrobacterium group]P0A4N5.1 RecName: Full=Octopine transport system permease protein OccQ [Agrobacterium tumefaciens]P0A4N6.1 RecName: Full=Octopine transport system permease protein OccQ [Agrobacterium tumefaciens (strain Ach5)]AKC10927.1 octopine/nopaline transport system permease protein [Agrobacterium tumefaciens]AAA50514.1 transport protein [Agrobacterium tumefaciens]AAA98379.1 occQ [Agrobacterium tumefaciens]AVH45241.1 
MDYSQLMGFGPDGWGYDMLRATAMTMAVAFSGFTIGLVFGCLGAAASLSSSGALQAAASGYTTALRGIPDLLVIYLFYFGSSSVISNVASLFGSSGFVGASTFLIGALAIGVVSGAYQTQVLRGAVLALNKGEIEAGRAYGMGALLLFRRIVLPQAARYALPGVGNVWQLVLKESALISVIGLVELMRQAQVGSGSTRQPFSFYLTAAALYLLITFVSGQVFRLAETRSMRGLQRGV